MADILRLPIEVPTLLISYKTKFHCFFTSFREYSKFLLLETSMAERIGTTPYLLPFHIIQVGSSQPIAPESTWSGVCKLQWRINALDEQGQPVTLTMNGSGFLLAFDEAGRSRKGLLTCHHVMLDNNTLVPSNQVNITFQQHPNSFTLDEIADPNELPICDPDSDFYYQEVSPGFPQQAGGFHINFLTRAMAPHSFDVFFLAHYPEGGERNVSIGKFIPQTELSANQVFYTKASTRPGSSGGALIESDGVNGFVFAMHIGTIADGTIDHSILIAYIISRITGDEIGPLGIPLHMAHSVQSLLRMFRSNSISPTMARTNL